MRETTCKLAQGLTDIATQVHPDSAIRAEGLKAAERINRFRADFAVDPRVARAFAALDTRPLLPEKLALSVTISLFRDV